MKPDCNGRRSARIVLPERRATGALDPIRGRAAAQAVRFLHTVASTFEHEGKLVDNTDVFFLGRHEPQGVTLHFETQAERAAMKEIRWWTITALERTSEAVSPTDLAVVLRRLVEPGVRLP